MLARWVVLGFVATLLGIFSTTVATKHTTLAKTKAYTTEVASTATLSNQPLTAATGNLDVANHGWASLMASGHILLSLVSTSSESTLLILSGLSFVSIALFLRSRSHIASTADRP